MISLFKKDSQKGKDYIEQKYGVEVSPVSSIDSNLECMFSIYDKVCEEYNPPFVSKNLKTAIRSIKESLKGQQSLMCMHPEDYLLVYLGCFDKNTGLITPKENDLVYEISNIFVKEGESIDKVS